MNSVLRSGLCGSLGTRDRSLTPPRGLTIIYNMSIWNKILLGLIAVASLGFFYTASRTLRTYEFWCKKREAFRAALEKVQNDNEALRYADYDHKFPNSTVTVGIRGLQSELEQLQTNRGRIWEKCAPAIDARDAQSISVGVTTVQPNPNGISLKMILYAFEDGDDQHVGRYLGEFKVMQAGDNKVVLKPAGAMTEIEIRRLMASKGPWTLYELMPADQHELFVDMPDDRKKALLPEASVSEYLRDGQAAQPEDPPECKLDIPIKAKPGKEELGVPDGKYHRLLRDYKRIFTACRTDRILFNDSREALTRDNNYLAEASKDAQVQTQFAQDAMDKLKKSFSNAREQQTAVQGYMSVLQTRCARFKKLVDDAIEQNKKTADDIRRSQIEAARLIEQRTRTMGQLGAGN
jgi:hypothetical protein